MMLMQDQKQLPELHLAECQRKPANDPQADQDASPRAGVSWLLSRSYGVFVFLGQPDRGRARPGSA